MSPLTILFFVIGGILILFGVVNLFKQNQDEGSIKLLGIEANGSVTIIIIANGAAFFFVPIQYPEVFKDGLSQTPASITQERIDSLTNVIEDFRVEDDDLPIIADEDLDHHFSDFDALDDLDDQSIAVLDLFAIDLENHDWEKSISHFSSEHVVGQLNMFLDDFFHGISTDDLEMNELFPLYLCYSMNVTDFSDCYDVERIESIYYTGIDELDVEGSFTIEFTIVLDDGAESDGWFWLDQTSHKLHGPVG